MDVKLLKSLATEILTKAPSKPFFALPLSAVLYAALKDGHKIESKLVTGDLLYRDEVVFQQDSRVEDIKDGGFKEWAGHAWVEIDGLICDLSFFKTLYADVFTKPCKADLIDAFGEGRGFLMTSDAEMQNLNLFYKQKDVLSDEIATAIITGIDRF